MIALDPRKRRENAVGHLWPHEPQQVGALWVGAHVVWKQYHSDKLQS